MQLFNGDRRIVHWETIWNNRWIYALKGEEGGEMCATKKALRRTSENACLSLWQGVPPIMSGPAFFSASLNINFNIHSKTLNEIWVGIKDCKNCCILPSRMEEHSVSLEYIYFDFHIQWLFVASNYFQLSSFGQDAGRGDFFPSSKEVLLWLWCLSIFQPILLQIVSNFFLSNLCSKKTCFFKVFSFSFCVHVPLQK